MPTHLPIKIKWIAVLTPLYIQHCYWRCFRLKIFKIKSSRHLDIMESVLDENDIRFLTSSLLTKALHFAKVKIFWSNIIFN